MPHPPGSFSRFWKELKRRRALRSLAMDGLEKAYDNQDTNSPYIGLNLFSKEAFKIDDPRLTELLDKLNLTHPADP